MNWTTHELPEYMDIHENDSGVVFVDTRPQEVIDRDRKQEEQAERERLLDGMRRNRPDDLSPKTSDTGSPLFSAKYFGWCADCEEPWLKGDQIGYIKDHEGPLCEECYETTSTPNFDYSW